MTLPVTRSLPGGWVAAAAVVGAAVGYGLAVDPVVHSPGQALYPLVWLGVSAVALWRVVRPNLAVDATAALVGAGYTLLLLTVAGLVRTGGPGIGVSVHHGFPGWGPAVSVTGPVVFTLVPFLIVGYATLGALAAVTVGTSRTGTIPGVLGLFACVSCTAPLLAAILGTLGSGTLAAVLSRAQYPVATVAFLIAVAGFAAVLQSGG